MRIFWRQFRNELLKLFARKRTYLGFGSFLAVEAIILGLLQLPKAKKSFADVLTRNGYGFEEYYGGLTLAMLMISFTIMLLGGIYLALVSGDIVAKEVEDGTMRMILSRPISRIRLLCIKWASCIFYSLILIFFIGITSLLVSTIYRGGLGSFFVFSPMERIFGLFNTQEGFFHFWVGICVLSLSVQVISSLAFMFSCFNMKPAAATILTLSVLMVDLVLRSIPYFFEIERYFITYHTACWIRTYQNIVPWWEIGASLAYLLAMNVTFFVIGAMRFCTRDFKS